MEGKKRVRVCRRCDATQARLFCFRSLVDRPLVRRHLEAGGSLDSTGIVEDRRQLSSRLDAGSLAVFSLGTLFLDCFGADARRVVHCFLRWEV